MCSIVQSEVILSQNSKFEMQEVTIETLEDSGIEGDKALLLKRSHRHYGVVFPFEKTWNSDEHDAFILQYEVQLTEGLECGGAYMKVMDAEKLSDVSALSPDSPYIIMFGPDKCGATNKVHFILRHYNPVSKEWTEKHLKNPPGVRADEKPHVYTLIVRKDNSYEILIDGQSEKSGSLYDDMDPPINTPKQIDDENGNATGLMLNCLSISCALRYVFVLFGMRLCVWSDEKPDDWVDEAQIPDPTAVKPDDWDETAPEFIVDDAAVKPSGWLDNEPAMIPDPNAHEPEDWDEEEDGEWEAPLVSNPRCESAPGCGEWKRPMKRNPEYKGKWAPPLIDNPDYKGEWHPRKVDNPNFYEDPSPAHLPPMVSNLPLRPVCLS